MSEESPSPPKPFDWQKLLAPIVAAILAGGGASTFSNSQSNALEEQTKAEAVKLEARTEARITQLERQTFQLVTLWNFTQEQKIRNGLNELPDKFQ